MVAQWSLGIVLFMAGIFFPVCWLLMLYVMAQDPRDA